MPKDSPLKIGRRPQGQEGRAEQGLERPLPAGQGAGEGRRQILRHQAGVPAAGRRARRLRARRGRRLGDLGSVPRRRRSRDRRAHARRRQGHRRRTISSISPRRSPSPTRTRRSSTRARRARRGRRVGQGRHPSAVAEQLAPAVGIPAPVLEVALEAAGLRHQADRPTAWSPSSRRSPTRSSRSACFPKPIKIADAARRPGS